MRVVDHIFDSIIDIENLFISWREFRIGKNKKSDVLLFERNLEDNIWELYESLRNKTYFHLPYESFFIHDPKVRHIHKASVRDRVLHHAIVKILNPIFEQTFISDSFSCRIDKGTHRGVKKFVSFARQVSRNFSEPCWVLKCDVKKFFASVDQNTLLEILFRRIHDLDVRWLLKEIISSFQSEITQNQSQPKGIPIGNLTSQLFANIYLNELDQFMKHALKEHCYVRYADDFVVLHTHRDHCSKLAEPISEFLSSRLKLELHPRKIILRKFSQGVDFLGYLCFPHYCIPRPKTEKRIYKKLRGKAILVRDGKLPFNSFYQSVQSYFGILSHSDSYDLSEDLRNQIFFWLS
jgi:RNA-directed DNA polymerase